MLPQPDGHHRRDRMSVVGRTDSHGVDLSRYLVEHAAKVAKLSRPRKGFRLPAQEGIVDIAKRYDVAAFAGVVGIAGPLPPHADARDAEDLVGRPLGAAQVRPRNPGANSDCRRPPEELASVVLTLHGLAFLGR